MSGVDPSWCEICEFEKDCEYRGDDGEDKTSVVAGRDGSCIAFRESDLSEEVFEPKDEFEADIIL